MTFSSSNENKDIVEFEERYDENIPKLFKHISFYS